MPAPADQRNLTLFVPADRPGRVAKAAGVGADAVIAHANRTIARAGQAA